MLLSIISSSAVSAISSSAVSAIAITTTPGIPQYGSIVIAGLITLLSLKEVLTKSERWNRNIKNSFNMVILPLVLCFATIVTYKVAAII